jgi:hypothetical protein
MLRRNLSLAVILPLAAILAVAPAAAQGTNASALIATPMTPSVTISPNTNYGMGAQLYYSVENPTSAELGWFLYNVAAQVVWDPATGATDKNDTVQFNPSYMSALTLAPGETATNFQLGDVSVGHMDPGNAYGSWLVTVTGTAQDGVVTTAPVVVNVGNPTAQASAAPEFPTGAQLPGLIGVALGARRLRRFRRANR